MDTAVNPIRILVVDDNRDAAELVASLLSMCGHTTDLALDGMAGVQKADEFRPEVVLLDIGMPRMDGFEAAVKLRQIPGLEQIRIVGFTALSDARTLARMSAAGFDAHLAKPASFPEIVRALEQQAAGSPGTARSAHTELARYTRAA